MRWIEEKRFLVVGGRTVAELRAEFPERRLDTRSWFAHRAASVTDGNPHARCFLPGLDRECSSFRAVKPVRIAAAVVALVALGLSFATDQDVLWSLVALLAALVIGWAIWKERRA